MKYTDDQIEALVENTTRYHLMLQYLKEHVDSETWKRAKEYSKDFVDIIEIEISEENQDDEDYENYAED
jgi:hypothetical protein